jgi:transcriptional regulator with XRE-family HTH domain
MSDSLGIRVQRYRKRKGWTAQQLADATDGKVSRSVIANIESGRRSAPSVGDIVTLAIALGVPLLALVYDVEGPWAPAEFGGGSNLAAARAAEVYSHHSSAASFDPKVTRFYDLLISAEEEIARYQFISDNVIDKMNNPDFKPNTETMTYTSYTVARIEGRDIYVDDGEINQNDRYEIAQNVIDIARDMENLLAEPGPGTGELPPKYRKLAALPPDILERVRAIRAAVVRIISLYRDDIDYGQRDEQWAQRKWHRALDPKTGMLQRATPLDES